MRRSTSSVSCRDIGADTTMDAVEDTARRPRICASCAARRPSHRSLRAGGVASNEDPPKSPMLIVAAPTAVGRNLSADQSGNSKAASPSAKLSDADSELSAASEAMGTPCPKAGSAMAITSSDGLKGEPGVRGDARYSVGSNGDRVGSCMDTTCNAAVAVTRCSLPSASSQSVSSSSAHSLTSISDSSPSPLSWLLCSVTHASPAAQASSSSQSDSWSGRLPCSIRVVGTACARELQDM